MTWRIHFTPEDLARTRVAGTLGPLAETMFGLNLLRCAKRPHVLRGWRHEARRQVTPVMRPLATMIKLDLWTLTGEATTIEQGVEALVSMPDDAVRAELEWVVRAWGLAKPAYTALDEANRARGRLAASAYSSYKNLLEPHWPRLAARLAAERTWRGRVLLDGGVERLLATLSPARVRWHLPVLELVGMGHGDLHLDGRGLTLVPSVFVGDGPMLLRDLSDERAAPRLIFPVGPTDALWEREDDGRALGALVGRTRAAALRRIGDGCTTSELATYIGVSAAAASQHATVLREAGLITTRRHGGAALHALTTLGVDLLGSDLAS